MKIKAIEKIKEMDTRERRAYFGELLINNSLYIFLFAVILLIQFVNPRFLSFPSIVNILSLSAANLPLALGVAGAIILAGTDLSGGHVVGLVACVAAALLQSSSYAGNAARIKHLAGGTRFFDRDRPGGADRLSERLLHRHLSPAPLYRNAFYAVDRIRWPAAFFDDRQQQRAIDLRAG